ncbi:hypothetical protein DF3PA_160083 [Candidatus Defluviicoccus seviourii]|uniref:Uncharacterized protein n=2 Tax=root TaxID=1 RepID=A0A564WBK9_9PROT|nr:hypothetical protein DF3PB_3790005 [uncultured Defluviicoccus sp.]VUX45897.1 hypothetical protein DF3PA_160083 [Candidatus Defluviicoccus seviourii]
MLHWQRSPGPRKRALNVPPIIAAGAGLSSALLAQMARPHRPPPVICYHPEAVARTGEE